MKSRNPVVPLADKKKKKVTFFIENNELSNLSFEEEDNVSNLLFSSECLMELENDDDMEKFVDTDTWIIDDDSYYSDSVHLDYFDSYSRISEYECGGFEENLSIHLDADADDHEENISNVEIKSCQNLNCCPDKFNSESYQERLCRAESSRELCNLFNVSFEHIFDGAYLMKKITAEYCFKKRFIWCDPKKKTINWKKSHSSTSMKSLSLNSEISLVIKNNNTVISVQMTSNSLLRFTTLSGEFLQIQFSGSNATELCRDWHVVISTLLCNGNPPKI
mmetsp:Transcript_16328/g.22496  ORF Transcript_16328/g.22496 Transcript_16328/m.22496 type:complete len:277 (-) Transcript_16328:241-1071(-)